MNRKLRLLTVLLFTLVTTNLAGSPVLRSEQTAGKDSNDRVLLITDVSSDVNPVSQDLIQRLTREGISVTQLTELKEKDRLKIKSAVAASDDKDRKILKSFAFTSIIVLQISTNALAPFNDLYVSEARGTLKAINTADGKTIAMTVLPTARGFGNSQLQANRTAMENSAKEIPQDFIDRIIKSRSSRKA